MKLLRYYKDDGTLVEISINDVQNYLDDQTKKCDLADFIYKRHYHRYIKPFEYRSSNKIKSKSSNKLVNEYSLLYKNGFSVMANCCLLIEVLETFYRGWQNSKNKSEAAFLKFFTREKSFKEFAIDDMPTIFYKNIRNGILHQGETTGGWRITRDENNILLDINKKEINATQFLVKLKIALGNYKQELNEANWNDEVWKFARIKIKSIIRASKEY